MRFALTFCLLLSLLPLSAQEIALPVPNPDLETLKDSNHGFIIGMSRGMRKVAVNYQVLYATTDMNRIDQVYEAARKLEFSFKQSDPILGFSELILPSPAPSFDRSLKKNPELRRENTFLTNMIKANQSLYEILEKHRTPQDRLSHLLALSHAYPNHASTHVALAEVYWALAKTHLGDYHVNRALNNAAPGLFWPVAIVDAKRIARKYGIEQGLDALTLAEDLAFLPGNPAEKIAAEWKRELKIEYKRPLNYLVSTAQPDLIEKQAKETKNPDAYLALALLLSKQGNHTNASQALEEAINHSKDAVPYMQAFLDQGGYLTSDAKRNFAKHAKKALKKNPNNGMLILAATYGKRNPKQTKAATLKAAKLDPNNPTVIDAQLLAANLSKDNTQLMNLYDLKVANHLDSTNLVAAIMHANAAGENEAAFKYYQQALELDQDNLQVHEAFADVVKSLSEDHPMRQTFESQVLSNIKNAYREYDYAAVLDWVFPIEHLLTSKPDLNLLVANSLQAADYIAESLPFYEKATKDYPGNPAILELLANAQLAAADGPGARTTLNQLKQLQPERPGLSQKRIQAGKVTTPTLYDRTVRATTRNVPLLKPGQTWERFKNRETYFNSDSFDEKQKKSGRMIYKSIKEDDITVVNAIRLSFFRDLMTKSFPDPDTWVGSEMFNSARNKDIYRVRFPISFSAMNWNDYQTSYIMVVKETEPLLGDLLK